MLQCSELREVPEADMTARKRRELPAQLCPVLDVRRDQARCFQARICRLLSAMMRPACAKISKPSPRATATSVIPAASRRARQARSALKPRPELIDRWPPPFASFRPRAGWRRCLRPGAPDNWPAPARRRVCRAHCGGRHGGPSWTHIELYALPLPQKYEPFLKKFDGSISNRTLAAKPDCLSMRYQDSPTVTCQIGKLMPWPNC